MVSATLNVTQYSGEGTAHVLGPKAGARAGRPWSLRSSAESYFFLLHLLVPEPILDMLHHLAT